MASSPKSANETGTPINILFVAVNALEKMPECTVSICQNRAIKRLIKKHVQIDKKGVTIALASVKSSSCVRVCMTLEKR